ncbi:hypothetical protein A0U40_09880 [[Bacillus] sp. KCTC 13219]|nr:hypothetical protein A0U40_09880 [[Bacillus] sp. KCTC 13219]
MDNNVKHINYAVASGTNNYIVSITGIESFVEGLSIKVKFTNGNTAASTLNVNGLGAKDLVKSNGSALANGNIKAGQILHLVYTGINFQLLGEGGEYGNAVAADVLSGKTIGTEDGVVSGTMPNRGAVNQNLAANGSYTIPEGYHNGSGKVTQSLTTKSAETITPGTSNKTIAANQYLTGVQTILGDADLIAANIKQGVNIFGVTGTLNLASLGGTKFASGTVNLSSEPLSFRTYDGNNLPSFYHIQVSGLSFKPRMIVAVYVSGAAKHQAIYNNMTGQDGVSTSVHHNNSSQPQNNYLKANDNSGYVTSTSFRLPIVSTSNISSPNSGVVRWYAYE